MKKLVGLLTGLSVIIGLSSCDEMLSIAFENLEIEEVLELGIITDKSSNTRDTEIEIVLSFTGSKDIGMSLANSDTDDDFSDYLDQINEIEMQSMSYMFPSEYEGTDLSSCVLQNLTINISGEGIDYTENFGETMAGQIITPQLSVAESEALESILETPGGSFTVSISGQGSFTVDLEDVPMIMNMTVDANADVLSIIAG